MAGGSKGALSELRRLAPYLRRYRTKLYWGLLAITFSNICSTTIPRVVGTAVDALRSDTFTQDEIWVLIAQVLILTIGSGLGMYFTRRTIIVASRFVEEDLRNDFLAAIQVQSQQFYHDRSTGSLLAHFSNDIGAVREFMGPAIMYTANTITVFLFALSWMISIDGRLTLAIVVPIPFIAWATYTLGRKIHTRSRSVQQQYELVTTQAQETVSGIRVVRAYDRENNESQRFDSVSQDYYEKNMSLARVNAFMMPSMTVLFNIAYIVVIAMGGALIIENTLTVGELTQFFIYLNQMMWPVAAIGWVTGIIQRGAASLGRLGAITDVVPDIANSDETDHDVTDVKGHVQLHCVDLKYRADAPTVLSNISLDIPAGGSLGILGAVGSGKSSLVNLLPRLYEPSGGSITLDGKAIESIPLSVLRKSIAVVPQESFLFSESIRENIRFGRPEATDDAVLEAAELAQLAQDVAQLDKGYDTLVGERGVTLSGGQKQRTALARAIICKPSILILDDALSAVDTDTESRILSGLKTVMQGRTTLLISHRISTFKHCDSIIVLHNGAIVEQGTHKELLDLGGRYADTFERQQLEEELS